MKEAGKMSKSDLDYIASQLKQTEREAASTLAMKPAKRVRSFKKFKLALGIGIIIAIAFGVYKFQQGAKIRSAAAVESIQKLATLATAQANVKTIVSKEDNKLFGKSIPWDIPGSKTLLFLVVSGQVTAGVDLKNLTKEDVAVDNTKKEIHITLPHATIIQDPSINLKDIQTFSNEGLFRSEINWEEGFKQEELAKQKIKKEAKEFGLLKTAEDHARVALQDFFKHLDYTVTVTFK